MNPLEIPKLGKYINDFSGVFGSEQIEALSQKFINHETATTEQILTILIPHRQGHELPDIGVKVFNENGIGQKNLNNGLLLIVATEEKKIRIIVGKGLELKYTEMVCREIIENHLRPLLNEGKYEEMLNKWSKITTTGIIEIMQSGEESIKKSENKILNSIPKTSKIQKIIGQVIFGSLLLLFFGVFIGDEQNRFLYISLLFSVLFLLGGIIGTFRGKETKIQKILFRIVCITLGLVFLSGSYFQIYCHTQYVKYIPKNEEICKVFPIIIKYTGSGKNGSDGGSHSSSSSFGGGGGSSNGGGYGD